MPPCSHNSTTVACPRKPVTRWLFAPSCMHQPSSAHRCCVNAAYRAILVTPAHARFWLHGRPSRQAAGFNPTAHYFIVPCRTLSSFLSCRGAPPFTAVESMLGALSRPSIVHRRAISFITSILVTSSFLEITKSSHRLVLSNSLSLAYLCRKVSPRIC